MKSLLNFLIEIGKLKKVKRKGITFYGVKNPDSATDHIFRVAIMSWFFGRGKNLNLEKMFKIAFLHDICKVLTGDITPYDGLLPRNKKERKKFVRRWRRLPKKEKERKYLEKFKKEYSAIKKLTKNFPEKLRGEIIELWLDYARMVSQESKFVHQVDVLENLLEAFEWWQKNKNFPTKPWWQHADEAIDDKILLKFLKEIEKEELKKR
jgi:putative hydrolase of HD superfamily